VTGVGGQERGVVYAEFLLAFAPLFTLFLAGVQLSILASADLVVRHAANQAARAAVVIIDDDPFFYRGEARKRVSFAGQAVTSENTVVQRMLGQLWDVLLHTPTGLGARGGERLNKVRQAAYLPLSTISPSAEQVARLVPFATLARPTLAEDSLEAELGDDAPLRIATGLGVYARVAAAINFVSAGEVDADEVRSLDVAFRDGESVRLRVTYLMPCNVPLVRSLICDDIGDVSGLKQLVHDTLALDPRSLEAFWTAGKTWAGMPATLERFRNRLRELARAEWSFLQPAIYARTSERFAVLTADASLTNHGAAYRYYSELAEKDGVP
jgi:hypothetical protein